MFPSPTLAAPEQIVARIDAIILELETLRQQILNTPATIYRPPVAEVQTLVKELRGKYAVGGSLTQAVMDEHCLELAREDSQFQIKVTPQTLKVFSDKTGRKFAKYAR